jgi:hypothetical protein
MYICKIIIASFVLSGISITNLIKKNEIYSLLLCWFFVVGEEDEIERK